MSSRTEARRPVSRRRDCSSRPRDRRATILQPPRSPRRTPDLESRHCRRLASGDSGAVGDQSSALASSSDGKSPSQVRGRSAAALRARPPRPPNRRRACQEGDPQLGPCPERQQRAAAQTALAQLTDTNESPATKLIDNLNGPRGRSVRRAPERRAIGTAALPMDNARPARRRFRRKPVRGESIASGRHQRRREDRVRSHPSAHTALHPRSR